MGYNDLRDIAPVLRGHACLYGQSIHAMFPQSFQMYTVVLEKQATKQLARLQELWWKQATEDLANEEAKWMYTVVLEKQATKQLARLQELWWKQATEDLANEEAKWMYTVVLEKQATKQLARLQELWWKQATEDLANEEAKWVKLKDKKASYRIRKGN
ncbi:hypothetical protein TNCV_3695051 [Trichonephila clavipes]|nr:hypothetical protein TNCV_3695051 [Trichonephila clavipes]